MSITAYQVNNGMPTPSADRHMYNLLSGGQCGTISGMQLTKNGTQITVSDGWGIINGCIFRVKNETLEAPTASSGTQNGRLLIRLNTVTPTIEFAFQTASTLPALVQETGDNFTYEMELCRYQVSGVTIISDLNTSNRTYANIDFSDLNGYIKTTDNSSKTLSMSLNTSTNTLTIGGTLPTVS